MKKIQKRYLYILILIVFTSCKDTVDQMYYAGDISTFSVSSKITSLKAEKLKLDSSFFGDMYAYDSLLIFQDHSQASYLFKVYNAFTQKIIGSFVSRGRGNNEMHDASPIFHFYKENNEIKTLLFAPNESKIFVWNISQSIIQRKTVFDEVFPYKWKNEHPTAYSNVTKINKDTIITRIPGTCNTENQITVPSVQVRTLSSNKAVRDITLYKEAVPEMKRGKFMTEYLFGAQSCITPDGSKIIQVMVYLGQMDIIDVQTGEVKGLRLAGTEDFSLFLTDMQDAIHYYHRVQTNGKHIYALWDGEKFAKKTYYSMNTLHVFDMNGKMLKQIKLEAPITSFWLDPVNNLLYGKNSNTEEIYRYKLNDAEL